MSTVIVTKEVEVNVVEIPDYTEEINKIKVAKEAVNNALESCETKAYEMGEDIIEQIGIYVFNLMQPFVSKCDYKGISSYFRNSLFPDYIYLNWGMRNNIPFFILQSAGTYDDCELLMEFYQDDWEVVRNVMSAKTLAKVVTEWPKIKGKLLDESKRFINNQKSAMEKASHEMIETVKVINSFEL